MLPFMLFQFIGFERGHRGGGSSSEVFFLLDALTNSSSTTAVWGRCLLDSAEVRASAIFPYMHTHIAACRSAKMKV